ncbi:hypothetical protein SpiGrapes_0520 [Sphaerochaeta pleomorpha str. Grapes]|uniref:Uncharacterized protein n=1 Tax=Sphaerochaeta pleomorpha (strain ATCC BAA-1885 / DSM 22778 / Grapes) TaxID=158190 RepID=G8QWT0_SPHPG|nr:hypothetical protein [Sphaerochaeta pleomorpha]AEV28374.1 hypothetical protein SpiGrapes_0520 [Sphaerochaeta pleomorpha str. Grapes]
MDMSEFFRIRRQAYLMIALTIAGLLLVFLLHRFFPDASFAREANRVNSVIALLATTLFAIGFPILLRTGYFQKGAKSGGLHVSDFSRMKHLVGYSVGIGEICMLFAYYVPIYTYHLYLTVLVGIYGIYSIFPSKDTYKKELRSFGVLDDNA